MSRVRTFIGLDLGKQLRARVVALQEKFALSGSDVKWVEPENIHVTLLFLGEVDDRELMPICRAVEQAAESMEPFAITVEGVGCFPNVCRPRILWVGVGEGAQQVLALHDALEPPLLELGCYRREERQFTPHITMGRIKGERPAHNLAAELAKHQAWKGGETTIEEVHVMSSELTPKGPTYTVLSRAKLGA